MIPHRHPVPLVLSQQGGGWRGSGTPWRREGVPGAVHPPPHRSSHWMMNPRAPSPQVQQSVVVRTPQRGVQLGVEPPPHPPRCLRRCPPPSSHRSCCVWMRPLAPPRTILVWVRCAAAAAAGRCRRCRCHCCHCCCLTLAGTAGTDVIAVIAARDRCDGCVRHSVDHRRHYCCCCCHCWTQPDGCAGSEHCRRGLSRYGAFHPPPHRCCCCCRLS